VHEAYAQLSGFRRFSLGLKYWQLGLSASRIFGNKKTLIAVSLLAFSCDFFKQKIILKVLTPASTHTT